MPKINPEILRWARERAGLTAEDAAKAIGLSGAHAVDRLEEMERGEREPTRRQLGEIAKKYRRPLLTFYLPAPPPPGKRTHDFRTLPEQQAGGDAVLDALLRDVKARQALVLGAIEETDGDDTLPFVDSMLPKHGAAAIAEEMGRILDFRREDYRAAKNVEDAFKQLRDACERAGVYVILMGNLGSFHSDLGPEVFRGFAMADPVAPFIVINENDTRSAWAFTLLHEFAHILLGESGISGYGSHEAVERVCDSAAAHFLLGANELAELRASMGSLDPLADAIGAFANPRKVSRTMVAYNLWRTGMIGAPMYRDLADRFTAERIERANRQAKGGGVDYYVVRRHRVGQGLIRLVNRMVAEGALTSTAAGRVLGVKPTAVGRMTEQAA
jgi:Zn-dependent peptidase ImmA (M78 family)